MLKRSSPTHFPTEHCLLLSPPLTAFFPSNAALTRGMTRGTTHMILITLLLPAIDSRIHVGSSCNPPSVLQRFSSPSSTDLAATRRLICMHVCEGWARYFLNAILLNFVVPRVRELVLARA
ncbi:hypothetical protein PLEOSDRAFT_1090555 [Pleurotus ostreatus PC15]|uniref:Uncharacterized protein n=1 Tax=Pleurotus ostreatus (strain PC15) TaxID=1137138 RepID=A0A067N6V6_PLEO1|nr:hypothetical protein PLEOSDRAFT_1090555 [Pleurotus ostreatus PC15]